MTDLIVLAKRPRPGRVKTRLCPPLAPEQAAAVAAAALTDTLAAVETTNVTRRILAFDGPPDAWLPRGWDWTRQPTGGLDERLIAAFGAVRGPALLVGMDTPQLTSELLSSFDPSRYDACLGRADDGGYWCIGFADPAHASAIRGVPMSRSDTAAHQLERLTLAGLRVQLLPTLVDVDTIETALQVARLAPHTRFAAELATMIEAAA